MKRYIYIFFLLILLSCGKEDGPVSGSRCIEIAVSTPDVTVGTKAELTGDALQSPNNLYLYVEQSDGSSSYPIVSMPGAQLQYNKNVKVWNPMEYVYVYESGYYQYKYQSLTWDNSRKSYYRFYGFAHTPVASGSELQISNATYGRQFTITQPVGGDGTTTIDYLLSSLVNVAPSANYPLVPIELEHALARVDVDVQIAQSMFNGDDCLVDDITISISGIRRKATMLCQNPKIYGAEGTNSWYITYETADDATYTMNISNTEVNLEGEDTNLDMSFMAIPVANADMADEDAGPDYVLTLEYNNAPKKGAPKDYTYTFNLKDFSPDGWVGGHKVKYVLTIDNSIHLKGTVVDYHEVDYIEAVVVPDISGTK